jgi:hypothetical protein
VVTLVWKNPEVQIRGLVSRGVSVIARLQFQSAVALCLLHSSSSVVYCMAHFSALAPTLATCPSC